jgi:biotin carboxyl carrier protein
MGTLMHDVARGASAGQFVVRDGDRVAEVYAVSSGGKAWIFHDGAVFEVSPERTKSAHAHGALTSPMPATVIAVHAGPGDEVRKGDVLVVLEAMKMELPVRAPGDGRVTAVHCRPGDLVQPDVSLIDLE